MGYVNKVMLMGNTTRDPEMRQLSTGTAVCDFGLATNRIYKTAGGEEKQETLFVDCTAFGRIAEVIAEFCPKGRQIFVEGRLHFESWEDKNANRRSRLSVIVESFQFVGGRDQGVAGGGHSRELPFGPAVEKKEPARLAAPAARPLEPRKAAETRPPLRQAPENRLSRKHGKSRAGADENQAVDQMAQESEHLEDADLPF